MSVDNKVPAIRFKGFSGDWDKEILGEHVKLENGFAFQSKYFKKMPTTIIVLTPGSVNIGGGFQAGKGQYYDEKQEVSSKYIFKPDDMFITMTDLTPTAQALGYPAIIPKDENTYLHNQRLGKLVGFNGDLAFLYSLLCTMKKQKEVVLTSSGTTVKHTSPDKFLNRICLFPKKEEQTQIGNYFQKLDILINKHEQKHEKLSNIKKAMLEKMFPKQGETIPEIRFKGFSGEWEEKELGNDIAEIVGGGTPSTEIPEFWDGDIDWYSPTEIGINVYAGGSQKKITALGLNNSSAKILPAGNTVLFTSRAGIGDMAILVKPGATNQGFQSLIVKEGFSPYFIYSAGKQIKEFALKHASGSTFLEISGKQLGRMKILTPNLEEQTIIGNYFQKLDELINQHQQQITKLNNIKQACLSKMFV
ncbi:restriction endonuclease subunit S [Orbus wheelerorum]|uniref:restriction endonuclease subunit S n=1 Tax=Orbus wheelerorum TaxID=3074111 RepID=UPI00370D23B3